MPNKTIIFLTLFAIISAISYNRIYDFISYSGLFSKLPEAYSGDWCRKIEGVEACEDIVIHHESGYAFMACGNVYHRKTHWYPPAGIFKNQSIQIREQVFVYNINSDILLPLNFKNYPDDEDVVLHGLGIHQDSTDSNVLYIFLINHKRSGSVIEIFSHRIGSHELQYLETIKNELIRTPNGVLPISKNEFYITNDRYYYRPGFKRLFELITHFPWTNVVFYSGVNNKSEIVADRLIYANGITGNWDNSLIYLATTTGTEFFIYERKRDNKLKLLDSIKIGYMMDNVRVDDLTGEIYLALLVNPIQTELFMNGFYETRVPTMIMKISNNTNEDKFYGIKYSKEIVYQDDGSFLNFVTVAAVDRRRNTLLLSSVYDKGFVKCKLEH